MVVVSTRSTPVEASRQAHSGSRWCTSSSCWCTLGLAIAISLKSRGGVAFEITIICVFFVLWAYIQEIQGELEGSKFDITGRALSGLLRWIGTIERSSSSLRTPSGHFRMCSNKNNYFKS